MLIQDNYIDKITFLDIIYIYMSAIESSPTATAYELIHNADKLSETAKRYMDLEMQVPVMVSKDDSLRLKVLDQCGMACSFCHNEGTPVSSDNSKLASGEFTPAGKSGRVSIYLATNGADFVSGTVKPDTDFEDSLDKLKLAVPYSEVHLTGGEPTLHPNITEIVAMLSRRGETVKMTSNGENFYPIAHKLKEAGLSKVIFSIFGTTPDELAAVQGPKYANPKFAAIKLAALDKSIHAASDAGIAVAANIVIPNRDHIERAKRVIEEYGNVCKIRILNSLDDGVEAYNAIYELLDDLEAAPISVNITAGASGMSIDYILPDGKEIGFKQIRKSYLDTSCNDCNLKDNGCDEGFYGMRMYPDRDGGYRMGICIQRMDLTRPLDEFLASDLPEALVNNRQEEYNRLQSKL